MAKAIRFEQGTMIAARFQLAEPLGDGGMGVVYRATDTGSGRPCALKFIRPELVASEAAMEKFLAEAKFSEQVGAHPNIVEVFGSGVDPESNLPFLAMELLEGDELGTWVKKNAPLDKNTLCTLFEQLGSALDEAHRSGVVHRDLKSANLFVVKDGAGKAQLKVLDFGIAKMFGDSAQTATIIGTPQYCAPEQLGASMRAMAAEKGFTIATGISPATDVFAIGLVAYEVLTDSDIGEYWGAHDVGALMLKTVLEPRTNPSDRAGLNALNLPNGFDDWFKRCTAHNAADRFQTAGEALGVLVALIRGEAVDIGRRAFETNPTVVQETVVGAPAGVTQLAPPAATLHAAPPVGLVYEGAQHQPQQAPMPLTGPPNAPPVFAPQARQQSGAGVWLVVGGLVALIVMLAGGGFLAYHLTVAEADTDSTESRDDDDDGSARGRRERKPERPDPPQTPPSSHETAAVPVRADDPKWGNDDAPATIVVFTDFQCPYCSRLEGAFSGLQTKYGEDKLRIVWKDFPLEFHKDAEPAHIAARAVHDLGGDKAFWRFKEQAFNNQRDLTATNFELWAVSAGERVDKFQAALADPKHAARVAANIAEGKSLGVKGTPASFVNGKMVSGARDQAAFETEIDAELAAATSLVAGGMPPGQIYIERARINFVSPAGTPTPSPTPSTSDSTTVWKVPVSPDDPYKGNRDALVTIVEFSEFQCPFCAKVTPTLAKLLTDYGPKLRLVWKDNPLPFHKRAMPAAIMAREIFKQKGDAGFWAMHDTLFANQSNLEDADLWRYAATAGANVAKVQDAVSTDKYKTFIESSQTLAADFAASGTPHFFVNGRRLVGAQPEAAFKTIIDEEIIVASKALASGTPPSALYDTLIKSGKSPDPLERKSVASPPADTPFKGDRSARVVVQVFSDFQCPFCNRVNSTLTTVLSTYGSQVKVMWRHNPLAFHKDAQLAHEAAIEAYVQQGDAGFWKMHDKLFANQKALSPADLETYASQLGLNMTKFRAAMADRRHRARVDADKAVASTAGISGVPGFVVNGIFISGAQPFSKFKKVIDTALSELP